MDANGTRLHALTGARDWTALIGDESSSQLEWDAERQGLGLRKRLFRFPTSAGEQQLGPKDRRGAAWDRFGNRYWISSDETEILMLPPEALAPGHFWSAEDLPSRNAAGVGGTFRPKPAADPPEPVLLQGMAITEHQYLVVGVLDPPGLLIFDLHGAGAPTYAPWPDGIPFAPFDIAAAPNGGAWILDRVNGPRYWALNDCLQVVSARQPLRVIREPSSDFRSARTPARRPAPVVLPAGIHLELTVPVSVSDPVAIEALPDGTVLVLEGATPGGASVVHRFCFDELKGSVRLDASSIVDDPEALPELAPIPGHDLAFVPHAGSDGIVTGQLFIAHVNSNQAFAFELEADDTLRLRLRNAYFPMRRFGGKGLVSDGARLHYDYKDRWQPIVEQKRPRFEEAGRLLVGTPGGDADMPYFDGKDPDCVWHRVFMDAVIPRGASVRVETRASNAASRLAATPWRLEPQLHRRRAGAELPYLRPHAQSEEYRDGVGTWEVVLQHARGRYLQLRLRLHGPRNATPSIRNLRVYYPRFSYTEEYLPAIYQENTSSASTLERFLANPEGFFTVLEDRIAQAQLLFDGRTAPREFLDWLAGWLAVVFDTAWDESRKRLFITHAAQLYRERGTVPGLIRALRLATDAEPTEALFSEPVPGTTQQERPARVTQYRLRIREHFARCGTPPPTANELPKVSETPPASDPEQLHRRYRTFLRDCYRDVASLAAAWERNIVHFDTVELPPVQPDHPVEAEDWRRFLRSRLGFAYAVVDAHDPTHLEAYRVFLARRYRRVAALNLAYQSDELAFDRIDFPERLPAGGKRLRDWIDFVSVVLPTRHNAHRFAVLVPTTTLGGSKRQGPDPEVVRRLVDLGKPAHTAFEIKEYWSLFVIGEARLGVDTVIDRGSRLSAVLLGQSRLAAATLAEPYPWNVEDRFVTGRDRLKRKPTARPRGDRPW